MVKRLVAGVLLCFTIDAYAQVGETVIRGYTPPTPIPVFVSPKPIVVPQPTVSPNPAAAQTIIIQAPAVIPAAKASVTKEILPGVPPSIDQALTPTNISNIVKWRDFLRNVAECTGGTFIMSGLDKQASPVIYQIIDWDVNGACFMTLISEEQRGVYSKTDCHLTTDTLDMMTDYYSRLLDGADVDSQDRIDFLNAFTAQCVNSPP